MAWEDKITISDAVLSLAPKSGFTVDKDNNVSDFRNEDGLTQPTAGAIVTEQTRLQTEYDALAYARARDNAYPNLKEFVEAYTEKEIGEDSTKWDAYVVKYNKVRTDNSKP